MYKTFLYSAEKYNFQKVIGHAMPISDKMEELHRFVFEKYDKLFEVGMDSSTVFHKMFYDKYRAGWPELVNLYELFIKNRISNLFDGDFLYQAFPTFRVHLPDNVAVGAFHNDAEFGHPKGEKNFIIPLTDSEDTASVWVESEPGKKDFTAMHLMPGTFIMFNGNELTHGNKVNLTGKTRVSIDFRCLSLKDYDENNNSTSITRKTKFIIGEYYKLFKT